MAVDSRNTATIGQCLSQCHQGNSNRNAGKAVEGRGGGGGGNGGGMGRGSKGGEGVDERKTVLATRLPNLGVQVQGNSSIFYLLYLVFFCFLLN